MSQHIPTNHSPQLIVYVLAALPGDHLNSLSHLFEERRGATWLWHAVAHPNWMKSDHCQVAGFLHLERPSCQVFLQDN